MRWNAFSEDSRRSRMPYKALSRWVVDPSSTDSLVYLVYFNLGFKNSKWRKEFGVDQLNPETDEYMKKEVDSSKVVVLDHRDNLGRPIIFMRVKYHNAYERDLDKFTRFIVYILEKACKKCFDDVIDNLCVVFDLEGFSYSIMDYQFTKNLIWLLSKHYPERLGVCLVLNSSYLFSSCWMMVKPWYRTICLLLLLKRTPSKSHLSNSIICSWTSIYRLSEKTSSKVVITSSDQISSYLVPEVLPKEIQKA